jgi:hypothetical protein
MDTSRNGGRATLGFVCVETKEPVVDGYHPIHGVESVGKTCSASVRDEVPKCHVVSQGLIGLCSIRITTSLESLLVHDVVDDGLRGGEPIDIRAIELYTSRSKDGNRIIEVRGEEIAR